MQEQVERSIFGLEVELSTLEAAKNILNQYNRQDIIEVANRLLDIANNQS